MDADVKPTSSITAMAVWLVRLLLPFLLFWIWYRTQAPAGPGKHVYSRDLLLSLKDAKEEGQETEVPEAVKSIRLAPDAQVQRVLGPSATRGGGGGPGARGPRALQRSGSGHSTPSATPQIGEKKAPRGAPIDEDDDYAAGVGAGSSAAATAAGSKQVLSDKERMQHEALLNFVAFSYQDQPQRVFLSAGPPPPPPRRKAPRQGDAEAEEKANADAQVVLKAATNPKLRIRSAEFVKSLTRYMTETGVSPAEATYALMVETCVNAGDLRGASDILMRMESAGHCADTELLDRVMDLYSAARGDQAGEDGSLAEPHRIHSDED